MSTPSTDPRFDLAFEDLIVWVDTKRCCQKTKTPKIPIPDPTTEITESSINQDRNMYETYVTDPGNTEIHESQPGFRQIRDSGMDEIRREQGQILNAETTFNEDHSYPHPGAIPILKNVTGLIQYGTMTAIIGPSGSGKTTLLNFLSSRSNWDAKMYVDGQLSVNGKVVKSVSKYKNLIGFVPQEDILIKEGTVRQNLETYGNLRGRIDTEAKVEEIIEALQLGKCADTIVGAAENRGISGGEKKRLSIGVEMMSDPKLIFLDEPTTGLDAYTALEVVKCLKAQNLKKDMTVVAVLHQPRQEIVDLFDQVGRFVYIYIWGFLFIIFV